MGRIIIVLFFLLNLGVYAQVGNSKYEIPDSLKTKEYEEIIRAYDKSPNDTIKSLIYLNASLQKAIEKKDSLKMSESYCLLNFYEKDDSLRLAYLNNSIQLSKGLNNKFFPSYPYSVKGYYYFRKWDYQNALDNYLLCLEYAKKTDSKDYIYFAKHNIGTIKNKLGKHQEALSIFKECLQYEDQKETIKDTVDYLYVYLDLAKTYVYNQRIDSSSYYTEKGLNLANKINDKIYYEFVFNEGVNLYHNAKYTQATDSIEKSLPFLAKLEDKADFLNAYLYLGKIGEALEKDDEAFMYYKKIDSIFQSTNFVTPEVRESYLLLIDRYKSKGDLENQLFYVERLLKFDEILRNNYAFLNEKLVKEYDTPELLEEKDKLIQSINGANLKYKGFNTLLIIVVVITVGLVYYQYKKRRLYAKRFEVLINEKNQAPNKTSKQETKDDQSKENIGISEEIIEKVLQKIDKFEEDLGFLESNITTGKLATKFETNSKYLSRIINTYKKKSFIQYINDLRIDFVVEKLKEDRKMRNYTIKAISREIGFNTTEAFSKSFHKKTGIYPSYFIKRLDSQDNI